MMMDSGFPEITHLGGEECVTGSCHLVRVNELNILVDCGMARGGDYVAPMGEWPVAPSEVDFLFLTHARKRRLRGWEVERTLWR
jgi:metallo-beta-lactamase family protein